LLPPWANAHWSPPFEELAPLHWLPPDALPPLSLPMPPMYIDPLALWLFPPLLPFDGFPMPGLPAVPTPTPTPTQSDRIAGAGRNSRVHTYTSHARQMCLEPGPAGVQHFRIREKVVCVPVICAPVLKALMRHSQPVSARDLMDADRGIQFGTLKLRIDDLTECGVMITQPDPQRDLLFWQPDPLGTLTFWRPDRNSYYLCDRLWPHAPLVESNSPAPFDATPPTTVVERPSKRHRPVVVHRYQLKPGDADNKWQLILGERSAAFDANHVPTVNAFLCAPEHRLSRTALTNANPSWTVRNCLSGVRALRKSGLDIRFEADGSYRLNGIKSGGEST
jgi:hypothetical protein